MGVSQTKEDYTKVVMVLHADERRKAVVDRVVLHLVELICPARAHADVANVSGLYDIMESLHRLFDGSVVIESVALQEINVIELETLEGCFDRIEYVL